VPRGSPWLGHMAYYHSPITMPGIIHWFFHMSSIMPSQQPANSLLCQLMPIVPTTLAHATSHPCSGAMCHNITHPCLHLSTSTPMNLATPVVWLYVLYSELPCHHCACCTINIFFCLFDKTNGLRYLSHTMSVWVHSSCVGFISMRPTHTSFLNPLWALWCLGLPGTILVLRSNSRSFLQVGSSELGGCNHLLAGAVDCNGL